MSDVTDPSTVVESWPRRILPVDPMQNRGHDRVVAEEVQAVLAYPGHSGLLYNHAGKLVELRDGRIMPVDDGTLVTMLDRSCAIETPGRGPTGTPRWSRPDRTDREAMRATPYLWFPALKSIVATPFIDEAGRPVLSPGYDSTSQLYVAWRGLLPDICEDDLRECLDRLLDFPFKTAADQAHALGLYLMPLLRQMIKGPTPMHLITAPMERNGKSYLAEVAGCIALGRLPQARKIDAWGAEASRELAIFLSERPAYLFLDNLPTNTTIGGADLHRWIASQGDVAVRLVGGGRSSTFPITCTWVATGIQIDVDNELAARTVPIRLKSLPNQQFKTAKLVEWVLENHDFVLACLLKFVQEWLDAGQPPPARSLSGFGEWSRVVGGVVSFQGARWAKTWLHPHHRPVPADMRDWNELLRNWTVELDGEFSWLSASSALKVADSHGMEIVTGSGRSAETAMGRALLKFVESGRSLGGLGLEVKQVRAGRSYRPVILVAPDVETPSAVQGANRGASVTARQPLDTEGGLE